MAEVDGVQNIGVIAIITGRMVHGLYHHLNVEIIN